MNLEKKSLQLNEEWQQRMGPDEDQGCSQAIDEDSNGASSDDSMFEEEDGLDEDEFVDEDGKSITAEQVRESLTEVLKKRQERLNEDLQEMTKKGSFEEEGVSVSDEEDTEESSESEHE